MKAWWPDLFAAIHVPPDETRKMSVPAKDAGFADLKANDVASSHEE
jgi:hypothetical protein